MDSVVKFQSPSTCIVSGATGTGKTHFVFRVLLQANKMFTKPVKIIYYCYGVNQPLFDEMKQKLNNIVFHEGLPSRDMLQSWAIDEPDHKLLIFDDLLQKASKSVGCS